MKIEINSVEAIYLNDAISQECDYLENFISGLGEKTIIGQEEAEELEESKRALVHLKNIKSRLGAEIESTLNSTQ